MIEPSELFARYTQGRMDMNAGITLPEYFFALQYVTAAAFIQGMTSMATTMMFGSETVRASLDRRQRAPRVLLSYAEKDPHAPRF